MAGRAKPQIRRGVELTWIIIDGGLLMDLHAQLKTKIDVATERMLWRENFATIRNYSDAWNRNQRQ
jgi:hypothetical protein